MSIWKWCRIPGIRSTYSPVNFTREHAGQIIFLHFSNSIVNMLAKSENMLAKSLVNMLTEALVNMLTEALVNIKNEVFNDKHIYLKAGINIYLIRYIKYDESSTITLKSFLKCRVFLVDHLKTSNWVYNFVVQIWLLWSCVFLSTWLKDCKSSFLVAEQLSNYSNIREKSLLHE